MNKLVKCIYSEEKMKWDSNVAKQEYIPVKEGVQSYKYSYVLNKKVLTF